MTSLNIDLNPITVELEFGALIGATYKKSRFVVYLHGEPVKHGDWVPESFFWDGDLDNIRQEYTALYQKFLAKQFQESLEKEDW